MSVQHRVIAAFITVSAIHRRKDVDGGSCTLKIGSTAAGLSFYKLVLVVNSHPVKKILSVVEFRIGRLE